MDSVKRSDSGPLQIGSSALVRQPKLRPATWTVDVLDREANFTWSTKGPGCRISAVHRFSGGEGSCTAELELHVTGGLSWLIWALTGKTARTYLDQEAAALKAHCEAGS
jgi:hypothetical protein